MPKYQLNFNNTDNTNNTKESLKAAYEQQEIQMNKEHAVIWKSTHPYTYNKIEWEDTYIIEPSGKMTKIHKNANAPFNMIADENPAYHFSSGSFQDARHRLDEQIANNAMDGDDSMPDDSSQRSGGTQEQ